MHGFPVRSCTKLLLLIAGVLLCDICPAWAQTTTDQGSPTRITAVKMVAPEDFQLSFKDHWSGGLPQRLPFRMTEDSQGRILVTDPPLALVQVLDTKQKKRWQIQGDRNQRMVYPTYIAVDGDDNIYVSEPILGAVLVFQPDGRYLRTIGQDRLYLPFGLAVDAANHRLYVADHLRGEIQVYTLEGQFLQAISRRGAQPGDLMYPCDLVLHHGMLFVLDTGNLRIQIFDLEGNSKGTWPFGNDRWPVNFAFDTAGNLYYIDMESLGMKVSEPSGSQLAALGVKIPYGQPRNWSAIPSFLSLTENRDGTVLALRPALAIDALKLQSGAALPASAKSALAQARYFSGHDHQSLIIEVKGSWEQRDSNR